MEIHSFEEWIVRERDPGRNLQVPAIRYWFLHKLNGDLSKLNMISGAIAVEKAYKWIRGLRDSIQFAGLTDEILHVFDDGFTVVRPGPRGLKRDGRNLRNCMGSARLRRLLPGDAEQYFTLRDEAGLAVTMWVVQRNTLRQRPPGQIGWSRALIAIAGSDNGSPHPVHIGKVLEFLIRSSPDLFADACTLRTLAHAVPDRFVYDSEALRSSFQDSRLHSFDDQPALRFGNRHAWYRDGELHRDGDQPALIKKHRQVWFSHGQIHRAVGPALIWGRHRVRFRRGVPVDEVGALTASSIARRALLAAEVFHAGRKRSLSRLAARIRAFISEQRCRPSLAFPPALAVEARIEITRPRHTIRGRDRELLVRLPPRLRRRVLRKIRRKHFRSGWWVIEPVWPAPPEARTRKQADRPCG